MMPLMHKLMAIEGLISFFREQARDSGPDSAAAHTVQALKEIALDYRARMGETPTVAEHILTQRVIAASRCKVPEHRDALTQLAQETISRWPVIRAALARQAALAEEER